MTSGELIYVDVDEARGFTTAEVAAGATTLSLDSAALLPADLAQVSIDGEIYDVESLTIAVDEDLAGTLVLADPLVADVELGQPVDAVPATDVTYGLVAVAGDSEPTRVLVPQADQDSMSLTLGPREYGQGEAVEFSTGPRGPELTWVQGRLARDASYLDPATVGPLLDDTEFAADLAAVMEGLGEVTEFGWISARLVEGDVIATALSGQRVQISTAGIASYNAADEVTALLSAALGGLDLSGALRVTGSGGIVVSDGGDIAVGDDGNIFLQGGQLLSFGATSLTQVGPLGFAVKTVDVGNPLGTFPLVEIHPGSIQLYRAAGSSARIASLSNGNLTVDSSTGAAFLRGTTDVYVQATGGDATVSSTGNTYIEGSTVRSAAIAVTTTGGAANVWVNSSTGTLARSTSSRRYKRDETTWQADGRNILNLIGKRYRDRGEYADNPDSRWYANLIAEDLHAAGFNEFVVYDDEGRPDNIMEGRLMAVAGLDALRALDARLTALEDAA